MVKLAEILTADYEGRKIHTMFIDSAGISRAVGAWLRQLGDQNVSLNDVMSARLSLLNKGKVAQDKHVWRSVKVPK